MVALHNIKWTKQALYVGRDARGVIVRVQEARPIDYKEPKETGLREPRKKRRDAIEKRQD